MAPRHGMRLAAENRLSTRCRSDKALVKIEAHFHFDEGRGIDGHHRHRGIGRDRGGIHRDGPRRVPRGEEQCGTLRRRAIARADGNPGGAEVEADEVSRVFQGYGLTAEASAPVVEALPKNPEAWIDFMMRFELGLEKPQPKRAGQRPDHCRGLCRWGHQPRWPLYRLCPSTHRVALLGDRLPDCADGVRTH
jgi:hypothetical protein